MRGRSVSGSTGSCTVKVARAGIHLRVTRSGSGCCATLDVTPTDALHRPSADELFKSVALAYGDRTLAVVLTGMGSDGLAGARAIRAAGGRVFAEDASTCVVDGMPRAVRDAGLASAVAPLDGMARAIVDALG